MRIFLLTGEPSGDLHGAYLARAIHAVQPTAEIIGVGGTRMRQAGVNLVAESEHWGAIGIPEALRKVPGLFVQMRRLVRLLRHSPPDVLVLIDFGAFNVRLLRRLQGSGIPVVYYIPPGCWSHRRKPGQLPFLLDAIATPFPWSAENLRAAGAPAQIEWVGHPLMAYTHVSCTRNEARERLGVANDRPVVALLPGSRRAEIHYLLSVFFDTVRVLTPAPYVLLSVAPSIGQEAVRSHIPPDLEVRVLDGVEYDLMQAADAALVASGTATLELACLNVPMVVAYRGSFLSWLQYQFLVHTGALKQVALPNLLTDSTVVPELLGYAATPPAMAAALTPLLQETPARRAQLEAFARIRDWLGDGNACERTARMVLDVAAGHVTPPAPHASAAPGAPAQSTPAD